MKFLNKSLAFLKEFEYLFDNFRERAGIVIWVASLSIPGLLAYKDSHNDNIIFFWILCVVGFSVNIVFVEFESRETKDKLKHLAFEKNRDKIKLAILNRQIEDVSGDLMKRLADIEYELMEAKETMEKIK